MRILFFDLETTGLDPSSSQIIEVGAVVWDTETNRAIAAQSDLILHPELIVNSRAESITGINSEHLISFGVPLQFALHRLIAFASKCDAIGGHNIIGFDIPFLKIALTNEKLSLPSLPVLDTFYDLVGLDSTSSKRLNYLAADHGFLNPFPHRALFDAVTTAKIFSRYSAEECLRCANTPLVLLNARVDYEQRGLAQRFGFHWNKQDGCWQLRVRRYVAERLTFPFEFSFQVLETGI